MSSAPTVSKPLITRPKPGGANVRAFLERVEKGSKPEPDFFNPEVAKLRKSALANEDTNVSTKPAANADSGPAAVRKLSETKTKPPVLHKKPSITSNASNSQQSVPTVSVKQAPKCVISRESLPPPPPAPATSGSTPDEEEQRCPSEDSGHSTCELKYSGSMSSNHSSSHEPHYQRLSELDEGYSEHTTSSHGSSIKTHDKKSDEETPCYSAPTFVPAPAIQETSLSNRSHSKYKYHVPSKLGGTLPRDRKKAAVIGKAVAKGRSTLKKKTSSPSDKVGDNSQHSSAKDTAADGTLKCSERGDNTQSDQDFSDSDFDTDYTDSEWETDGEQSSSAAHEQQTADATVEHCQAAYNNSNNTVDDSVYDTYMELQGSTRPDTKQAVTPVDGGASQSRFYDDNDIDDATKLVTLMRDHSSKKEKQQRFKKRLKLIKNNIGDIKRKPAVQKFVKSSNNKLSAVKSFIGKFKKPAAPSPDYSLESGAGPPISSTEDMRGRKHLSTFSGSQCSGSHSDVHSISSYNSVQHHHTPAINQSPSSHLQTGDQSPPNNLPTGDQSHQGILQSRSKAKPDVRQRTQSMGALLVPPPLPPRATRSQYFEDVDDLPPPPPPPRTTSMALTSTPSPSEDDRELTSVPSLSLPTQRQSSHNNYTPKFVKAKPLASPRLSKTGSVVEPSSLKLSLPANMLEKRVSAPELSLRKAHSTSVLPPHTSAETSLPAVPTRRESSKSLVVSSPDDESHKRKTEILNSAKRTTLLRQNSVKLTSPIDEEKSTPISPVSASAPPSGSFMIGGDDPNDEYDSVRDELIEDEPLYQEYHECMMSSVRNPSISKTSTLMKGGQPSLSLWSTTPQVLNSGVLDHMNAEEIKLQEAMFEVITSEASYLRSIKMLNKVFVNSVQFCNEEILSARDKKALFSNIAAVEEVSTRLFSELERHWKSSVILTAVCEIINNYAHREFDVYIKYCSNQSFQDRTLKKLQTDNLRFQETLHSLERSPECHGLSMSSFLLLPMQRITRLPLLLDAILRRQEVWSDQYRAAQTCYECLKKVVMRCNEGARKMEQTEQVLSIENKLLFNKIKKIPLTSASRQLIKKGELVHLSVDGGKSVSSYMNTKPKSMSLFLFNDLLLITKKKSDNFSVLDYTARVNVEIEPWSVGRIGDPRLTTMAQKCQAKFLFMLILLENHQKKHAEFLLGCNSETERTRWTEAFTPQVQEDSDDKIYESWDCPQVQITHEYVAQQPDELNLQAGERLNVLRKTADGWYEGERVNDGQIGWLPASYTIELQNEHVRARNLKERYKLLQAAAKMMK